MRYRRFGRTGWSTGEIGYGMWGMGSWTGSDDRESLASLQLAVDLGCNFFDTAWAYGAGHSERLLRELVRGNPGRRLYTATKVPPLNGAWPARPEYALKEVFPAAHIRSFAERSLGNLGLESIDLLQFHVWDDSWAESEEWRRAVEDLRGDGLVHAIGISINRWEPWNALETVRSGAIDAVQVIYNIFDQSPEDELFPLCRALDVAVIARVPFDEGALTGALTPDTRWPEGDWRNIYFGPANLAPTLERVRAIADELPSGMSMPEAALRFILSNDDVSVTIPGMRRPQHVRSNIAASEAGALPDAVRAALRAHRWDRSPTSWSS
jgi:aryl-alcohol dehydrogenase-like predicted oxidoreductase